MFSTKLWLKSYGSLEISVGGVLNHWDFAPFFRKTIFQNFSRISEVSCPEKPRFDSFSKTKSKTFFRKEIMKSRWGNHLPKLRVINIFYRKLKVNNFEVGVSYRRFGAFISKIDIRNFYQLRKNVHSILSCRFFWKIEGYFEVAPEIVL